MYEKLAEYAKSVRHVKAHAVQADLPVEGPYVEVTHVNKEYTHFYCTLEKGDKFMLGMDPTSSYAKSLAKQSPGTKKAI